MIHVKLYLDKRSQKNDVSFPIKIGISNLGKNFHISTGVSCYEDNWENGTIGKAETNYNTKNTIIHKKVNQINLLLIDLERKGIKNISNA